MLPAFYFASRLNVHKMPPGSLYASNLGCYGIISITTATAYTTALPPCQCDDAKTMRPAILNVRIRTRWHFPITMKIFSHITLIFEQSTIHETKTKMILTSYVFADVLQCPWLQLPSHQGALLSEHFIFFDIVFLLGKLTFRKLKCTFESCFPHPFYKAHCHIFNKHKRKRTIARTIGDAATTDM